MINITDIRPLCGLDKDDGSRDETLLLLLDNAAEFASEYTGGDVPDTALARMVAEDFGRLGSAGVQYKSYSHIAENYRGDYSETVYRILNRHRRVRVIVSDGGDVDA